MKRIFILLFVVSVSSGFSRAEELWKGEPSPREFNAGGLMGAAIIGGDVGFALLGNLGKKIVHQGFSPEINNQVFIETILGPVFISGGTAFFYSFHLRWDFQKDENWAFYGLAGVGGQILPTELGDGSRVFPRTGLGFFRKIRDGILWRSELSHEIIATGVSFDF